MCRRAEERMWTNVDQFQLAIEVVAETILLEECAAGTWVDLDWNWQEAIQCPSYLGQVLVGFEESISNWAIK